MPGAAQALKSPVSRPCSRPGQRRRPPLALASSSPARFLSHIPRHQHRRQHLLPPALCTPSSCLHRQTVRNRPYLRRLSIQRQSHSRRQRHPPRQTPRQLWHRHPGQRQRRQQRSRQRRIHLLQPRRIRQRRPRRTHRRLPKHPRPRRTCRRLPKHPRRRRRRRQPRPQAHLICALPT